MPTSRNNRKSKRQNNRIKSINRMKSYERKTTLFHRQPKNGGSVIGIVAWDNEALKKFYMENRGKYPDTTNGAYLAAFTSTLWNSVQSDYPQPTKGEWVVYHLGKGLIGPCIRIGGYSGDIIPDEVEFDFYVMKRWGLTRADLYEARDICATLRQKEIDGFIQVNSVTA